MELSRLKKVSDVEWRIEPSQGMRVPGVIYASEALVRAMDDKVYEQLSNVARLPGIVRAAYAMPDAHWGYGFPIGGVAAFDPNAGGIVSAGGVGFDISCGVRLLSTNLRKGDIEAVALRLADELFRTIPAGLGRGGLIVLDDDEMEAMLHDGAAWAVSKGWGAEEDLDRIEEHGRMPGADPEEVSARARERQRDEMGTLGSGNHYLEVQQVSELLEPSTARQWGLETGQVVVSIHSGSRGLGHQIGSEFLKRMSAAAEGFGIRLPDRQLACAPIDSTLGQAYLGAMRAGINCALANRQILTHWTRMAFSQVFPQARLKLLYDVSHNTCKEEYHPLAGQPKQRLFVHRKGATRALGAGHPDLPIDFQQTGQPVLVGGSMGTESYVLVGTSGAEDCGFSSACHGAGRAMSRHEAGRRWQGARLVEELRQRGILVRSVSMRGVAEEAPGAYKDVRSVVAGATQAGLARPVALLQPLICVKG